MLLVIIMVDLVVDIIRPMLRMVNNGISLMIAPYILLGWVMLLVPVPICYSIKGFNEIYLQR